MFKQLIAKIIANKLILGFGKIALISTVGISTATSTAFLYSSFTDSKSKPNDTILNQINPVVLNDTTSQVIDTNNIDDIETSTTSSNLTNGELNLNEFVMDIVTSASKIVTNAFNGNANPTQAADVNTSPSKQNSTSLIGTTIPTIEDTNTGSSRTVSVGGTLVFMDDDDENEHEFESVENEEDKDDKEDKEYEDDEDDEDDDDDNEDDDEQENDKDED